MSARTTTHQTLRSDVDDVASPNNRDDASASAALAM